MLVSPLHSAHGAVQFKQVLGEDEVVVVPRGQKA